MRKIFDEWVSRGGNFLEEVDIGGVAIPMPPLDIEGVGVFFEENM